MHCSIDVAAHPPGPWTGEGRSHHRLSVYEAVVRDWLSRGYVLISIEIPQTLNWFVDHAMWLSHDLGPVGRPCVLTDMLVCGVGPMMRCNLPLMVATNARRRIHFELACCASPAPMCSLAKCMCRLRLGPLSIHSNAMTQSGVIPPPMMAPSNAIVICTHFRPSWITRRCSDRHVIILKHFLQHFKRLHYRVHFLLRIVASLICIGFLIVLRVHSYSS